MTVTFVRQSQLQVWKCNSQMKKLSLWKAFAMCLGRRKRIRVLQELQDYVSMNAAINKLLHFHQTLARYSFGSFLSFFYLS